MKMINAMIFGMVGVLTIIANLLLATPLLATPYTYDFSLVPSHSPTTNFDPGMSENFTTNGITITAYGFSSVGMATDLYVKNSGVGEMGLGLNSNIDHEIAGRGFVQVDLAHLIAAVGGTVTVVIESVQTGENFSLYKSSTLGQVGSLFSGIGAVNCGTVNCSELITLTATNHYLSLKGGGTLGDKNVLLGPLTSVVPEPSFLILLGLSLVGLAAWHWKRQGSPLA